MATYKGVDIDTSPTEGMVEEAQKGLDWREEFGRGGTEVGVARARDIVNRRNLSIDTVKRMASYFARHEVDKEAEGFRPGEEGYPSAGRIAWALWGGSPAQTWANAIMDRIDNIDEEDRSLEEMRPYPNEHAARITDPDQYQGFRRMNDELGDGIDIILGVKDGESEIQAIRFDAEKFTADEARQWLEDNGYDPILFEPATEERAMQRAEPDELEIGDFVEWESAGGMARGQIEEIVRDGQIEVPNSEVVINGEPDDPAALIRVFDSEGNPSDVMVGHRFSTLTKIDPIESEEIELEDSEERKANVEVVHRAQDMEARAIDEESRRIRMSISSEFPVERSFGMEVLEHSEEAIDLSFIASGRAPFLMDHDPEKVIGVLESVELDPETRRLRAVARLGKGALAREAFDDIVDGIKSNISIGYAINKMERKDGETYVAKSWKPLEASLVSLPADQSEIGIGRSGQVPQITVTSNDQEGHQMTDQIDVAAIEAQARKAAEKNAAQIVELGQRHNQGAMAQEAIAKGQSVEEFRGALLEKIGSDKALDSQEIGLTKKERQRYSLLNAVRYMANPTDRKAREAAAFEIECSEAAQRAFNQSARGILLPAEVMRNWKRDLNSTDDAALFTDDFRGGDFIESLVNASSVMQAGSTVLQGLSGDVKIPRKTGTASAGWVAESTNVSESEMTVGSVTMTPKTVGVHTDISRQLLLQTAASLDVEALVRADLSRAIALAIDLGGLEGSGSSGQPTGILNTSGVNTVTAFAAANPTWAETITLETAVAEDNALMGNLAYIMPASMYGALKTTLKDSGSGQFVVEPGGTINGYRAIVSNQATAGNLYFGNFADLLMGFFGGLDIYLDESALALQGGLRIIALQSMDIAVRHAVSFAYGNDGV